MAEYVIWQIDEERLDWLALDDNGEYQPLPADGNGVVESRVFHGPRLDVPAMLAGDLGTVLAQLG